MRSDDVDWRSALLDRLQRGLPAESGIHDASGLEQGIEITVAYVESLTERLRRIHALATQLLAIFDDEAH